MSQQQMSLNSDEALNNFKSMFPGVPDDIITEILRRNNGDVEKIVNELLAFSSNPTSSGASSSSARNSDYFFLEPPPPYSEVIKKHEATTMAQPSSSSSSLSQMEPTKTSNPFSSSSTSTKPTTTTSSVQDETFDDEKIAAMIQNEEFLNYLKSNSTFMREVYGTSSMPNSNPSSYNRSASRTSAISSSSRPSSYSSSSHALRPHRSDTYLPLTPNGPIVEYAATSSIPNGPLVDFNYNDSTIWSKRIKSKLPGSNKKSTDLVYSDSCNSTAVEPYYSQSDFSSKLRTMSRASKLMFLTLARKFSMRPSMKLLPDYETSGSSTSDRSSRRAFQ